MKLSAVSQTTGGLEHSKFLGKIQQDFLLLPELPISLVENLRHSGICSALLLSYGKYDLR